MPKSEDANELETLRDRMAAMEERERARSIRLRRSLLFVFLVGAFVSVGSLAANGNCPNGLPYCFVAGTPALSSQVNTNFAQLKEWLEAKTGAVDGGTTLSNVTVAGDLNVSGGLRVSGSSFGAYQTGPQPDGGTFATGTTYVASTDGFVVSHMVTNLNGAQCVSNCVIDGVMRAQTTVQYNTGAFLEVSDGSFTCPVKKGSSWRIDYINAPGQTSLSCLFDISWVPFGAP
jgi:hypothetical protein